MSTGPYSDARCSSATSNPNNTAGSSAAHSLVAVEGGLFSELMVSLSNPTLNTMTKQVFRPN